MVSSLEFSISQAFEILFGLGLMRLLLELAGLENKAKLRGNLHDPLARQGPCPFHDDGFVDRNDLRNLAYAWERPFGWPGPLLQLRQ